ncbi:hypothetical protein SL103_22660 [Streptomyces lydicus]|uniref:Uncharacterized protein n=1 Tax=Streptomyces lydicus TaxID=47763 RepID=A0A1D7VPI1_9ACTN|nr:hypothetical protein SL103_22660 [Streptomyces lydicus]
MESASPSYTAPRHQVETVAHCARLHFRFPLGFRQGEEVVLQRGVTVPCGTVRSWCLTFGRGREAQGTVRVEQFGGGRTPAGNEPGQHRGDASVFVFGALRPRRHEVRQT